DVGDEQDEGERARDDRKGDFGGAGEQITELEDSGERADDAEEGDDECDVHTDLRPLDADPPADDEHDAEDRRDECRPAGEARDDPTDHPDENEDDSDPDGGL